MEKETRHHRLSRKELHKFATTIILCISMVLLVIFLATSINIRVKTYANSEDYIFSALDSIHPLKSVAILSNSSSSFPNLMTLNKPSTEKGREFGEWVAPEELWHSMTDEELTRRASMVRPMREFPFNHTRKVAFMFLTKGKLPLAPLWELFFKGHEEFFSIYLHTSPEFTIEPPQSSVFYKRRVPSKEVKWGKPSMIDAERRLLANALLDFSNEQFVLLSETCIPLFNFTTIYSYLMNSNLSFLGLFDDPRKMGRGRYSKRMYPEISLSDWRKGSQWFEVHRDLAMKIVSDRKYYSVFEVHCGPPCYMDEHYLPTLVNKIGPELSANRSVTWADWSAGGSHPTTFVGKDVNGEFLNKIRHDSNCTYSSNSKEMLRPICFIFARKFHPSALPPLLQIAPGLFGFDP